MIEWVYKENLAQCLKSKRVAEREVNGERVDSDLVEANKLVLTGEGELYFGEDKINASAYEINALFY